MLDATGRGIRGLEGVLGVPLRRRPLHLLGFKELGNI